MERSRRGTQEVVKKEEEVKGNLTGSIFCTWLHAFPRLFVRADSEASECEINVVFPDILRHFALARDLHDPQ